MCTHPCDVSIFPVTPAPWAPGSLHAWWPGTGTIEIRRSPDSWLHSKCNCGLFHTDLQGWCFMTGVPGKGYRGWYNHPAPTAGNSWIWGLLEVWEDATQQFWQTHTDRDRVQPEAKLTILPLVTKIYTGFQTFHLTHTLYSRDTVNIMYMHKEVSIQGRFQIPPQMLVAAKRPPNIIPIFCVWSESDMRQHSYGLATCVSYECYIQ